MSHTPFHPAERPGRSVTSTLAPSASAARAAFLLISVLFGLPAAVAALLATVPATMSALWYLAQGEFSAGTVAIWSVAVWVGVVAWARLSWAWCSGGQPGLRATNTRWWIALALGAVACALAAMAVERFTKIVSGPWLLLMGPPMMICAVKLAWLRWGWWGSASRSSDIGLPALQADTRRATAVQGEERLVPHASPLVLPNGRTPVGEGIDPLSDPPVDVSAVSRADGSVPNPQTHWAPAVKDSLQPVWFTLNCLLVGIPLMLVSLACVVLMLFGAAHGGGVEGVVLAFLLWIAAFGASVLALVRLSWRWLIRHEPLADGSRSAWGFMQATLLAQLLSWLAMLYAADFRFDRKFLPLVVILLIPGAPLAAAAAHLAWLRRRELMEGRRSGA